MIVDDKKFQVNLQNELNNKSQWWIDADESFNKLCH